MFLQAQVLVYVTNPLTKSISLELLTTVDI